MALFKFRKGSDAAPAGTPPEAESVEALRRRARHRLIGAAVLVLVAVVGFPLLFDTHPRPIAVDIPIEIPDRNKAKPLGQLPAAGNVAAPAGQGAGPGAGATGLASQPAATPGGEPARTALAAATPPRAEPAKPADRHLVPAEKPAARPDAEAKPVPRPEPVPRPAAEPAHVAKVEPRPADKPAADAKPARAEDAARAQALLEGKTVSAPASAAAESGRFIVQVGAYADNNKAREARLKVERAGLKTYVHVAETPEGKRIRVRAGPFPTRAEADKAAARIKALELPAAILTL